MKFSSALIATFAVLTIAAPMQKRAGVLGTKTYDEYIHPFCFEIQTLILAHRRSSQTHQANTKYVESPSPVAQLEMPKPKP